ncbi:hypothetical protein F3Y22_tig00111634pilonHSYRG00035 [Hibiscus syriacus]|uniref:Zinc knuckle CX2CX4HX4C domain-containing protein n=1 Tax=Hibiscus syriacus TaxID=106335 RepID=A0A6A2XZK6_HIBSY|nr:hypothetical protein F3Y22_tig00111634pilonHSYRG00035 [Hibiscus syriacus]
MADDILLQLGDLSFTEDEFSHVVTSLPSDQIKELGLENWIDGKFMSEIPVDGPALGGVFGEIWKSDNADEILELRPRFFHIKLRSAEAKDYILRRGPWSFNNVPLGLITKAMAISLGGSMGTVIAVDTRVLGGNMGDFLRVRVRFDAMKPLRRCIALGIPDNSKPRLCPVRYERLPIFCFGCGLLGHQAPSCRTVSITASSKLQYGEWMRLPPPKTTLPTSVKKGVGYVSVMELAPLTCPAALMVDRGKWPNLVKGSSHAADGAQVNKEVEGVVPIENNGLSPLSPTKSGQIVENTSTEVVVDNPSAGDMSNKIVVLEDTEYSNTSVMMVKTGLYASHHANLKIEVWSTIHSLRNASNFPWLLGGDLNAILHDSKKQGVRRKSRVQMDEFRMVLANNGLFYVKPSRGWFTWANHAIKEHIDHFVASQSWLQAFPNSKVFTEFAETSDHFYLLMDTAWVQPSSWDRGEDYFCFEQCWASEEACRILVKVAWDLPYSDILDKIVEVGSKLSSWQKVRLVTSRGIIQVLRNKINSSFSCHTSEAELQNLKRDKEELYLMLNKEEVYWMQRSQVQWLANGDRNTSYFHARDNGRIKKNYVRGLLDKNGIWKECKQDIKDIAVKYFQDLFASASIVSDDSIIDAIDTVITDEMNGALCADFTTDEIIAAFRDIHPLKAPDINGTLDMSLVNKKLEGLMASCIHETQAAFLPGRQISGNILVAHELIHYMNSSKNSSNKGAAIKLDIEKAYDRVEWYFMRKVMLKLGFCADWVNFIMRCVETVSFSVRINGSLTKEFRPNRGLRQDDPLSLFYFFSALRGYPLYLTVCRLKERFVEWGQEASIIRDALGAYEAVSGQKVNLEKSTLYFSPRTRQECLDQISSVLGIGEVSDLGHYLGMPLHIGKNKINTFGYLKEKVSNRIDGWTKHLLSFGGREVFLKAVAQSLPQYIMSCYRLPDCLVHDLVSNMRRYL